jgi:hypothetical protein
MLENENLWRNKFNYFGMEEIINNYAKERILIKQSNFVTEE